MKIPEKNLALNEKLKQARQNLHLSQAYVARTIGVSSSSFADMENGRRNANMNELDRLGQLYGLSAEELYGERKMSIADAVLIDGFGQLDDADKKAVFELVERKKEMVERKKEMAEKKSAQPELNESLVGTVVQTGYGLEM